jgi:hypothetical protein
MRPISNLNSVSIRNYGPNYETLAVIKELKKLGIIKSVAKAKRQSKPKMTEEVKQPSDMVGYVKTLGGAPNTALLPLITPGMTQQQIEDIQQRSNAALLALRGEVQQQRLQDIEAQQGQRFEDITKLGGIINPLLERFRGAQEPGAGQRPSPFVTTSQPILLPDVGEEEFTQTLNEGGPEAVSQLATDIYPEEEGISENIPTKPSLLPREPIKEGGGGVLEEIPISEQIKAQILKQTKTARERGVGELTLQQMSNLVSSDLGPVPKQADKLATIRDYYLRLADVLQIKKDVNKNKQEFLDEIKKILKKVTLQ